MDETAAIARLKRCGVIPVVVIEDASRAVDLAHALVAGGVDVVEVTLRRPAALEALAAIAKSVPKALPVAGTVVTPAQVAQVRDAGAEAVVSPGFSESVDEALRKAGFQLASGRCHGVRLHARRGRGADHRQVLPGRAGRRPAGAEGALRSVPQMNSARPAASA
ncbi:hypothetical protein BTHI11S_06314 [Bosea thiooxidans]